MVGRSEEKIIKFTFINTSMITLNFNMQFNKLFGNVTNLMDIFEKHWASLLLCKNFG